MLILGVTPVSGFLADEVWLFNQAQNKNEPLPPDYCYHSDGSWNMALLSQEIIRDAGIPGLLFRPVWIGRDNQGFCWIIPEYYRQNYSDPKIQEGIMRLKKLAHIPDEENPKWWALGDGRMPAQYGKAKWAKPEYKAMSIGYTLLRKPCQGCFDESAVEAYTDDEEE